MRFSILAILATAGLAAANPEPNLKPKPWAPLSVKGLKDCQAACFKAHLFQLSKGQVQIGKTTNAEFCSIPQPELSGWLQKEVIPCTKVVCGKCHSCPKSKSYPMLPCDTRNPEG
ncbi:uncharacterized protein BCR38DRAFT_340807 [Pseudomassariella vexata]|uniref:Uncharacterized protein n=1 Tax=Pseudomassariella vexata TaxID=1141098 RepID=A0A1Y2DZY8_9PEZI|nr:uncharacterized protein BCR38DRAFT_340807 [Pseudomassariella vexata]ORY64789.1 hypothetical protein BCR38DRAFT_340807 [Pseudomassariella vexata]